MENIRKNFAKKYSRSRYVTDSILKFMENPNEDEIYSLEEIKTETQPDREVLGDVIEYMDKYIDLLQSENRETPLSCFSYAYNSTKTIRENIAELEVKRKSFSDDIFTENLSGIIVESACGCKESMKMQPFTTYLVMHYIKAR